MAKALQTQKPIMHNFGFSFSKDGLTYRITATIPICYPTSVHSNARPVTTTVRDSDHDNYEPGSK